MQTSQNRIVFKWWTPSILHILIGYMFTQPVKEFLLWRSFIKSDKMNPDDKPGVRDWKDVEIYQAIEPNENMLSAALSEK